MHEESSGHLYSLNSNLLVIFSMRKWMHHKISLLELAGLSIITVCKDIRVTMSTKSILFILLLLQAKFRECVNTGDV